jgi:hypothetical protein
VNGTIRGTSAGLTAKQRETVAAALEANPPKRCKDVVVDINQSARRRHWGFGVAPCILPRGILWHARLNRKLTPMEHARLQGFRQEDFDALKHYAEERPVLLKDLVGNSFSTSVCMAATLALLLHAVPECIDQIGVWE